MIFSDRAQLPKFAIGLTFFKTISKPKVFQIFGLAESNRSTMRVGDENEIKSSTSFDFFCPFQGKNQRNNCQRVEGF